MSKNNSMINPSIVDLLKRVDNRYSLVVATSRRARQIIDGEETQIEDKNDKPLTIAINEVNEGVINVSEMNNEMANDDYESFEQVEGETEELEEVNSEENLETEEEGLI